MPLPIWAEPLPQAPLPDGYQGTPHAAPSSTDMDQGPSRLRHRSAVSRATITASWRMSLEAFRIFQKFYRDDLAEGTRWFQIPLWFGGAEMQTVTARFVDRWHGQPRAARSAIVSGQVEIREFPAVEPDAGTLASYVNEAGEAVWPAVLPPFPLRNGYDIDPHAQQLRSDFSGGPANKSNLFGASPGTVPVSWVMTAAQFEAFVSFYWFGLYRGLRWYRMSLWFGGGLDEAFVRFAGPWTFAPQRGDMVLVTSSLHVRRIPVVDGSVAAIYAAMSDSALAALVPRLEGWVHGVYPLVGAIAPEAIDDISDGLHGFVHTDYPDSI